MFAVLLNVGIYTQCESKINDSDWLECRDLLKILILKVNKEQPRRCVIAATPHTSTCSPEAIYLTCWLKHPTRYTLAYLPFRLSPGTSLSIPFAHTRTKDPLANVIVSLIMHLIQL